MNGSEGAPVPYGHTHVFLGSGHDRNARRTWAVIWLCGLMMMAEIVGGNLFGSLALVADGLHMSTHAGALLLAALAYSYARQHADDPRFVFGTGKLGDLAGFSSAIVLAMIALLIGYEAVARLMHPIAIDFNQAIPIAVIGLVVNVTSAWMLSGGSHDHKAHDHDLRAVTGLNGRRTSFEPDRVHQDRMAVGADNDRLKADQRRINADEKRLASDARMHNRVGMDADKRRLEADKRARAGDRKRLEIDDRRLRADERNSHH